MTEAACEDAGIESVLERLRVSPTFAMSLGSKELFHTNVLAFLLESEEPSLAPVQEALRDVLGIPVAPGGAELVRCAVWRELGNLDLVIVPLVAQEGKPSLARDRCVVVEAKLKAVPTAQQLAGYSARTAPLKLSRRGLGAAVQFRLSASSLAGASLPIAVAQKVLLSLETGRLPHQEWRSVTWRALNTALSKAVEGLAASVPHRQTWVDYSESLGLIVRVAEFARGLPNECRRNGSSFGSFYSELMADRWSSQRVHDLVGKAAYAAWAEWLMAAAGAEVARTAVDPASPCEIMLTRAQAGLTVEFPYGEFTVGVQVQGLELRRFVRSSHPAAYLEQFAANEALVSAWLTQAERGVALLGTAGNPVAWQLADGTGSPGRLTSLRVFNVQRFVYSFLPLGNLPFQSVEAMVLQSLESTSRLSESYRKVNEERAPG